MPHILYIEDDPLICDVFKIALEAHGHAVTTALNGADGLALHARHHYDLVAIDYNLPDLTGIDIARKLLVDDPDLPIIMVTGAGNEKVAAEAVSLGLSNYIIKDNPEIYIELLPNIIAGALDRAALIRENVAAEKALRIAHDQLEERVSERTKELYLSQIRLQNILNLAPEAVMAIDDSFAIELFNNSAEYIFGYDASEVIGRSVEALFPARFRTVYRKYVARFRRSHKPQIIMGEQSQVIARRKDGAEFPATVSLSKFKIGGKHVFTLLIRDITERKKIVGELHLAVANAKLADKSKIDFLANMSHELRTPLNSIIGFTEMIKGEMMGPFENKIYKGYVNLINESGNHLLSLVNDILDVSKIEAGVMELDEDDVGVADVINLSAKMVRHRAQISGVELTTDIPDDFPLVRADPVRLKQILLNLLDNAIKFTNAGGTVIASASQQHDGGINIQVTDTGIGIAADAIPQVLKPFGQVAEVMQRSQGGSGLGLPLVNSLIELHGGRMQIDSEIGKGTVVTIFLPPERTVAR